MFLAACVPSKHDERVQLSPQTPNIGKSSSDKTEVFEAFRRINKHFYSWKNILKRWWKFISTMSPKGNFLWRMFRRLVLSFVLFKLSIFLSNISKKIS
jgi:hypothetical protein